MSANEYVFVTHWQVRGAVAEVAEILGDAEDLPRWWPAVYLEVTKRGDVVELYTKGWLPYTLRWSFRVVGTRPDGFTLEAFGDFVGRGVWHFEQSGDEVAITYDWRIRAEKPLLRLFSPILKPIFAANHRWAMKTGEESLKIELARRHGEPHGKPPRPTFVRSAREARYR